MTTVIKVADCFMLGDNNYTITRHYRMECYKGSYLSPRGKRFSMTEKQCKLVLMKQRMRVKELTKQQVSENVLEPLN